MFCGLQTEKINKWQCHNFCHIAHVYQTAHLLDLAYSTCIFTKHNILKLDFICQNCIDCVTYGVNADDS